MQPTAVKDIAVSSALETNKVLRNTYLLLSMTLAFSAVTAGVSMAMGLSHMVGLVLTFVGLGLLFVVHKQADKASGLAWIFAFTGVMGAALGPILNFYAAMPGGGALIMQALAGTAVVFVTLSAYATTTKKDFSAWRGFLFTGLIVVILAGLANLFFQSYTVHLALSAAVVMLMSGLILFDTSRIVNGGETNYIRATVGLYLNVYNLFTALLHLLGASND